MSTPAKLLDVEDVMERCGLPRSTAYELMKRLHPHVRIGKLLRLPEATLERYIAQGGDPEWPGSTDAPTPRTSGAPAAIQTEHHGRSRRSRSRSAQLQKRRALLNGDD